MAKQVSTKQERTVFHRTRLSLPMQDLLGAVIRAFDARRYMVHAAGQGELEYHPETCGVCSGTGFILVPNMGEGEASDSDSDVVKEEDSDNDAQFASPPDHSPTSGAADPSSDPAAVAVSAALASALAATTLIATSGVPVQTASTPAVTTGVQVPPAAPAAAQVTSTNALGLTVTPAPAVGATYTISTVLPGFDSVGPNSANPMTPPDPENAVFTGPGEDRYYVITKGVRVGVFGGWQSTSPYVTAVPSASFSRHRTLQTAYQAYETAYQRGSVMYV
ncbi:hypothetical protein D9611_008020 [Ephemerocybe angulata]|uniref:Ribonuclease H1 N-terminal domain-containing protein n=1 Tax=Ephemerocybe angulata TaxID=980116 RepID=A0A8H5BYX3_9AGAR|nr:hypothetical protein D9611_008020 [Tulosesus angulatus]